MPFEDINAVARQTPDEQRGRQQYNARTKYTYKARIAAVAGSNTTPDGRVWVQKLGGASSGESTIRNAPVAVLPPNGTNVILRTGRIVNIAKNEEGRDYIKSNDVADLQAVNINPRQLNAADPSNKFRTFETLVNLACFAKGSEYLVIIYPGMYEKPDGTPAVFAGDKNFDLESYLPSTEGNQLVACIWLNIETGALSVTTSDELSQSTDLKTDVASGIAAIAEAAADAPDNCIGIWSWILREDSASITDANKYMDLRGIVGGKVRSGGGVTDNAITRYDGTTGARLQGSGATIDDSDNITTTGTVTTSGVIADALQLATATELTISSGAITVTQSYHTVDTESDAASDDLDTISGGSAGDLLLLQPANAARTVVIKHGTDNITTHNGTDITLDETRKFALLVYDGSNWNVLSFKQIASGDLATNSVTTGKIAPNTEVENFKNVKLTDDCFVEYYGDESDFTFFRFVQRVSSTPTVRADVGVLPTSGNLFFNVFGSSTYTPILIDRTTGTNTTMALQAASANTYDIGAVGAEYRTLHLGTSIRIFNTSDPSAAAGFVQHYAKNVSGTAEGFSMDGAGNIVQTTAHKPEQFDTSGRVTDYVIKESNVFDGYERELDIVGALMRLETDTGEQFIYSRRMDASRIQNRHTSRLRHYRRELQARRGKDYEMERYLRRQV